VCERGGQDAEKDTYPCYHRQRSSCIVRVGGGSHGKAGGKKKVMGKERRSKKKDLWKKVESYIISNPANFPSHHKIQDTLAHFHGFGVE
jgi:hypothetical protein